MIRVAGLLLLGVALAAEAVVVPHYVRVRDAWRPSYADLLDRDGEILHSQRLDLDALRLPWVERGELSPAFVAALIAFEDGRFVAHHGVDWRALVAALWQNATGTARRGASTITMQLAGLLEAGKARKGRRGLGEKWAQMRMATQLEATWSKDQILEAYVNLVSFRGELRGVGAAATVLFGKRPSGLDSNESILLATLVSTPNLPVARLARRACALARAHALATDCDTLRALAEQRLAGSRTAVPTAELAPHLGQRLLRTPGLPVATTLSARLQRLTQAILTEHLATLRARNVRDAAAIVVDNASGDVLAYVGAAGRQSRAPAVDGVRAPRQAGSTLKPFLYGLAFERRYLTPASLLEDTPINLETATGLYIPQNYDREFKGTVSARTALASSLNVPAIRVLVLTGVEALRSRLFDLGYAGITHDGAYYGYSLALGSAEVTLFEQANAYRTLANGGRYSPLRLDPAAPASQAVAVMSEAAAFLVTDVLSDSAARAVTFGLDNPLTTPFWSAVKTGTSKDMRDNWCVGFSDRYTVAVWVGNFEGDSMDEVSGISGAAPAWLDLMLALHAGAPARAPTPPVGVVARPISYMPALEQPRREWFMAGTEMDHIEHLTGAAVTPRIANPADGVVIALDPDIPRAHQTVQIESRGVPVGARYYLDGVLLAAAAAPYPWFPQPGFHRLELRSAGATLDTVSFTVRQPHQYR